MTKENKTRLCSASESTVFRQSKITIKSDPGFECGCLLDRCQNVVNSLPCLRQSFRRVSWKSATDCVRNVNKSPQSLSRNGNGKGSGKVIRNPHPGSDRHHKLIRSQS